MTWSGALQFICSLFSSVFWLRFSNRSHWGVFNSWKRSFFLQIPNGLVMFCLLFAIQSYLPPTVTFFGTHDVKRVHLKWFAFFLIHIWGSLVATGSGWFGETIKNRCMEDFESKKQKRVSTQEKEAIFFLWDLLPGFFSLPGSSISLTLNEIFAKVLKPFMNDSYFFVLLLQSTVLPSITGIVSYALMSKIPLNEENYAKITEKNNEIEMRQDFGERNAPNSGKKTKSDLEITTTERLVNIVLFAISGLLFIISTVYYLRMTVVAEREGVTGPVIASYLSMISFVFGLNFYLKF